MLINNSTPEQVADLLVKGIAADMEQLILAKLKELINPTLSALARDLAHNTAVHMRVYEFASTGEVRVQLGFNNKNVGYVEPGEDEYEIAQDGLSVRLRKKTQSKSGLL